MKLPRMDFYFSGRTIDAAIGRLSLNLGWYRYSPPALLVVQVLEYDPATYSLTILDVKVAKFVVAANLDITL